MTLRIIKTAKDNDLYYYAKEIEVNNKRFETPFFVLHNSIPASDFPQLGFNRMYEIWKTLKISEMQNILTDPGVERNIAKKIASQNNHITKNGAKTYFLAINGFEGNPLNFFNDQLIEFLISAVFLHTDIITFPIIRKLQFYITTPSLRDQLIDFIKNCYNIATTLNNKPIMAVIQPFAIKYMGSIIKTYLDLGINLFCFNFEGSGLSGYYPNYFQVLRELYRYDKNTFDNKIKYIINLKLPSNTYRYQPYPAENMMTPALATDIIGINHIAGGFKPMKSASTKKGKKKTTIKRKKSNTNLLDTNSYNYHRISTIGEFNSVFHKPIIKPNFPNFINANDNTRNYFRRKFNYLNTNIELQKLHGEIINNIPISKELQNKSGVQSDLFSKSSILDTYLHNRSIKYFFKP